MPDTTTGKPVHAALYARVSTADKGQDTETQLTPLRRLVEARRWHPAEYVDEGVSGSQSRRPALDRMTADVRAGREDTVVVHRFDRFARSTSHLLRALEQFRDLGVEFLSLTENAKTGPPVGKIVFVLVAAIGEFEKDPIKARAHGGPQGARAPRRAARTSSRRVLPDPGPPRAPGGRT